MPIWSRRTSAVLVTACLSAAVAFVQSGCGRGDGGVPARTADELRLATFNVEELSGPADSDPSGEAHLEAVAEAIRLADADILALQGVQSLETLRWFNETYLADAGYVESVSLDVGHARGVENAVLSRVPIVGGKVWPTLRLGGKHPSSAGGEPNPNSGKPIRFRRSPLMAGVQLPGERTPIMLFVVEHKGGDRFEYWREAEAKAIVRLASDIGMNQRIVILGSFHAKADDPCMNVYAEGGFLNASRLDDGPEKPTETSGDTTDFILANRAALGSIDTQNTFVVRSKEKAADVETEHFPVVVGLRTQDE